MHEEFQDEIYDDLSYRNINRDGNIIKKDDTDIKGKAKINVEEDAEDGVKIILKKDANNNIHEIKFVCSCGQTKSVILDYSEE